MKWQYSTIRECFYSNIHEMQSTHNIKTQKNQNIQGSQGNMHVSKCGKEQKKLGIIGVAHEEGV
jgi:hypothetical protein